MEVSVAYIEVLETKGLIYGPFMVFMASEGSGNKTLHLLC